MLQYLAKCLLTKRKPQYKLMYKWLTLFQDTTQWQESIRKKEGHTIFITFRITIFQSRTHNDIQIHRRYDTQVLSENQFHKRTSELAALNGVKESSISKGLFCSQQIGTIPTHILKILSVRSEKHYMAFIANTTSPLVIMITQDTELKGTHVKLKSIFQV
ncbi:hypothetical protein KSS87_021838 [Heliosperma pusillum]|nr:hypothetical protein KSS87_021838 [Heliosperma pusillum]